MSQDDLIPLILSLCTLKEDPDLPLWTLALPNCPLFPSNSSGTRRVSPLSLLLGSLIILSSMAYRPKFGSWNVKIKLWEFWEVPFLFQEILNFQHTYGFTLNLIRSRNQSWKVTSSLGCVSAFPTLRECKPLSQACASEGFHFNSPGAEKEKKKRIYIIKNEHTLGEILKVIVLQ